MVVGASSGSGPGSGSGSGSGSVSAPLNPLLRPLAATVAPSPHALLLPAAPPKHQLYDSSASREHKDSKAIPLSLNSNRPNLAYSNIPNDHEKPHSSTTSLPHQNALNDKLNKVANVKHDDDDFDIDSYYARLHAIPNVSLSKVDTQQTTVEESAFSEIDLNSSGATESDSTDNPSQKSLGLTSDLAQNFSQLPQVLPQVASTVLNSFTSMLSLGRFPAKPPISNETIEYNQSFVPDNNYPDAYNQDGSQTGEPAIPLFNKDEFSNDRRRSIGFHVDQTTSTLSSFQNLPSNPTLQTPQSQELAKNVAENPSNIGVGNLFRMTVKKKKMYAQVPGLTLGDVDSSSALHGMPQYNAFPQIPPNFNAHTIPALPPSYLPAQNTGDTSNIPNFNTLPPVDQSLNIFNPNQTVPESHSAVSIDATPPVLDSALKDKSSMNFSSISTHVPDDSFPSQLNASPFSDVPNVNSEHSFNLNALPSNDVVSTEVPLHLNERFNVDFGQNIVIQGGFSLTDEKNTPVSAPNVCLDSPFNYSDNTWQPKIDNRVIKANLKAKSIKTSPYSTSSPSKSSNLHTGEKTNMPTFSPISTPVASQNINKSFQEATDLSMISSKLQLLSNSANPMLPPVEILYSDKNIPSNLLEISNATQSTNENIDVPTFFDPSKFANNEVSDTNTQNLSTLLPPSIPPPSQQIQSQTDNKFRMSALKKRLTYYSGPIDYSNVHTPNPPSQIANVVQSQEPNINQFASNQVPFDENQSTPSKLGANFGLNVFQNTVNLLKLQNAVTSFFSPSQNSEVKNYEETSNEFPPPQQYSYIPSFSDSESIQDTPAFFSPSTMLPLNTVPPFAQATESVPSVEQDDFSNQLINNSATDEVKNVTNLFSNSSTTNAPHFFDVKNDRNIENSKLDQSHSFLTPNDFFSNESVPPMIDRNQFANDFQQIPTFYSNNIQPQWPNTLNSDQTMNSVTPNVPIAGTANSIFSDQSSNSIKDHNIFRSSIDALTANKETSEKGYIPKLNIKLEQAEFNVRNNYKVADYLIEPSDSGNDDLIIPEFSHSEILPKIDNLPFTKIEQICNASSDAFKNSIETKIQNTNDTRLNRQLEPVLTSSHPSAFVPIKYNTSHLDKELLTRQDADGQPNYISKLSIFNLKDNVDQSTLLNQNVRDEVSMLNSSQYSTSNMAVNDDPFSIYSNIDNQQSSALLCELPDKLVRGESADKLKMNLDNEDTVKADNEIKEIFSNVISEDPVKSDDIFSTHHNILNTSFDQNKFVNDFFSTEKLDENRVEKSSNTMLSFAMNDNAVNLETVIKPTESIFNTQHNILNDKSAFSDLNYNPNDVIQKPHDNLESYNSNSYLDNDNAVHLQTPLKSEENMLAQQNILNDNNTFFDLTNYNSNEIIQKPDFILREESSNPASYFDVNDAFDVQTSIKPEEDSFIRQLIANDDDNTLSENYNVNNTFDKPDNHKLESFNSVLSFAANDNAVPFHTVVKQEDNICIQKSTLNDSNTFFDLTNLNADNRIENFDNLFEKSFNPTLSFAGNDNAVSLQSAEKQEENVLNDNSEIFCFNNSGGHFEISKTDENQVKQVDSSSFASFTINTNEKNYFDSFTSPKDSTFEEFSNPNQHIDKNENSFNMLTNSLSSFEVPSTTKLECNFDNPPFNNICENASNDVFIKNFEESLVLNDKNISDSFNVTEMKISESTKTDSDSADPSATNSHVATTQNQTDKKEDAVPLFNFFSMMKSSDVPEFKL